MFEWNFKFGNTVKICKNNKFGFYHTLHIKFTVSVPDPKPTRHVPDKVWGWDRFLGDVVPWLFMQVSSTVIILFKILLEVTTCQQKNEIHLPWEQFHNVLKPWEVKVVQFTITNSANSTVKCVEDVDMYAHSLVPRSLFCGHPMAGPWKNRVCTCSVEKLRHTRCHWL